MLLAAFEEMSLYIGCVIKFLVKRSYAVDMDALWDKIMNKVESEKARSLSFVPGSCHRQLRVEIWFKKGTKADLARVCRIVEDAVGKENLVALHGEIFGIDAATDAAMKLTKEERHIHIEYERDKIPEDAVETTLATPEAKRRYKSRTTSTPNSIPVPTEQTVLPGPRSPEVHSSVSEHLKTRVGQQRNCRSQARIITDLTIKLYAMLAIVLIILIHIVYGAFLLLLL